MIRSVFGKVLDKLGLTSRDNVASWSLPQITSLSVGEFFTTEWGEYTGSYDGNSPFLLNKIATLKNVHFAKFDYQNIPFDAEMLETELFWKGKIVIIKILDKYIIADFETVSRDENNLPKKLKIVLKNKDIKAIETIYEVGIDCVIGYSDSPWLFGKQYLGVMMRIWEPLGVLYRTYLEILKNVALTNNKLILPIKTSADEVYKIQTNLLSGASVLPFADSNMDLSKTGEGDVILGFDDQGKKTTSLWENYYNLDNLINDALGIESDSSPKKERKLNSEISVNNSVSMGVSQAEILMRKKLIESFNEVFKENATIELRKPEKTDANLNEKEGEGSLGIKNE